MNIECKAKACLEFWGITCMDCKKKEHGKLVVFLWVEHRRGGKE